jgi:acyl-CoA thioester hydrolase
MYEKRIEIRWRDVDGYHHVNNAVYLTYLEETRDGWIEAVLGERRSWDFVLARIAIDFRQELRLEDDEVVGRCRLARIGNSSVRLREELVKRDGTLAAEAESVLVVRDEGQPRSRPLTDAERAALERVLAS